MFKRKSLAVILATNQQSRQGKKSISRAAILFQHLVTAGESFENYQKCSGVSSVVSLLEDEKNLLLRLLLQML